MSSCEGGGERLVLELISPLTVAWQPWAAQRYHARKPAGVTVPAVSRLALRLAGVSTWDSPTLTTYPVTRRASVTNAHSTQKITTNMHHFSALHPVLPQMHLIPPTIDRQLTREWRHSIIHYFFKT